MNIFRPILILVILATCLFSPETYSEPVYITFPSDIDWVMRKSDHFQVIYRRGQQRLAERSLLSAEKAYRLLNPIFPEIPENTWIVLADFQDSLNGYSLNLPYPHMVIFAAPPAPYELLSTLDDWLYSVILHEYVHTLHLFPASGLWGVMRSVFGTWVLPNALMPMHLHEGLATFFETELTEAGRGRSATFNMYRRKAVEAGVWGKDFVPLDLLDGTSRNWPMGVSPYFFGYYFYKCLWQMKGAKGIYSLTKSFSSNWPFFIHAPFEQTYGLDFRTLWKMTYEKNKAEAEKEINELKKKTLSTPEYLTKTRFYKSDLIPSPDGNRVAYRSSSPEIKTRVEIMDLETRKIADTFTVEPGSDSLCWGKNPAGEFILYLEPKGENGYRINRLRMRDMANSDFRILEMEKPNLNHLFELACSDDLSRLALYRETGGEGEVFWLTWGNDGKKMDTNPKLLLRWKIPEGSWVSSLAFAKKTLFFLLRKGTETRFLSWKEGSEPQQQHKVSGHAFSMVASQKDDELYAVWDQDNRNEIWGFNTQNWTHRKIIGLSGGTNAFCPTSYGWILTSYEHGGFDIALAKPLAENPPSPAPRKSESLNPSSIPQNLAQIDKLGPEQDYSPFNTLYPRTWVPMSLLVPSGVQMGIWIPGFDISQRHFYDIFAGYDTRGSGYARGQYFYRFGSSSSLYFGPYYTPSYVLSSNAYRLLYQWGVLGGWLGKLFSADPFFSFGLLYKSLDASALNRGSFRSAGIRAGVEHTFGTESIPPGIVIWGTSLSLKLDYYFKFLGSTDDYFAAIASWDQYLPAPWIKSHRFLIRSRMGYTEGTEFLNSYFEAGGELLFSQGKGAFLNRGYEPQSFYGRRIFNLNLEYKFPLWDIGRGFGLLPTFVNDIDGAFVADTTSLDNGPLSTSSQDIFSRFYSSAGLELSSSWKIAYYLPARIRLGVYRALDPGSRGQSWWVSLGFYSIL